MLKIIFFGDITGEPGRKVVRKVLPDLIKSEKPDLVLANVENLAHGKGVTVKTLEELMRMGIQGFTGGNHIFSKRDFSDEALNKFAAQVVRPANITGTYSGSSVIKLDTPKGKVLVGNFLGNVFMEKQFHDPIVPVFSVIDQWVADNKSADVVATFVDFHAEATSEKVAMGHHLSGKVSVLVGTHTHIPTADAKILPGGTAYITDVGMCGAAGSVLGVKKELSLARFLTGERVAFDIPEDALEAEVSYVIIEIDETTGKATKITSQHQIIKL
jgi:metallophosphoesterase (TIGR00282 family)